MGLCIAGREVTDPISLWRRYAAEHHGTLMEYDFGGRGNPYGLTVDEILRTRIINSRISDSQCGELEARAAEPGCPWFDVPENASLADAIPGVQGGLFDTAVNLYWYFTQKPIRYVRVAKIHKALHIKRPDLYPILDARLRNLYRERASLWVGRFTSPDRAITLRDSPPYWAAIRQDLLGNEAELDDYRMQLGSDPNATIRRMAGLSKLRLIDITAWRM